MPVPARLTVLGLPVEELLARLTIPVADPATVGSKLTWSVNDWPGFKVAGKVAPEMENCALVSVTEFTVKVVFPEEISVRLLADVVLRFTPPKSRAAALTV